MSTPCDVTSPSGMVKQVHRARGGVVTWDRATQAQVAVCVGCDQKITRWHRTAPWVVPVTRSE